MRRPSLPAALPLLLLVLAALPAAAPAAGPSLTGGLLPALGKGGGIGLGGPVTLDADTLTFDDEQGVFLAEGNVQVGVGTRVIRADRIRYDLKGREAEFAGSVRYEDQGDAFAFDRIVFNLDTERGILYNGTIHIKTNNYQIASDRFEKTGPRMFVVRQGNLTTCPCDPEPDWRFKVGRSSVSIDGYAVGSNLLFEIRGVPVLWLPWAAFPVKLTRQTGFLMPSIGSSSSKGFNATLPFYWAVSRWSDATVSVEWMSKRGVRPEAEFRYVLNPASEGTARFTWIDDRVEDAQRWRASGENLFRHRAGWTLNARWEFPSDNTFYRDFVDDEFLRKARAVPSRIFVSGDGGAASQALAVHWVEDLEEAGTDNTVRRLPEYTASLLPVTLWRTGVDVSASVEGTRFTRSSGEREWRARGIVEISRPVTLYQSVAFTPFVTVESLGDVLEPAGGGSTAESGRTVAGAGALLSADGRRDFPGDNGIRLVHTIRPQVGYRFVDDVDQVDIPLTDRWSRLSPQSQFTVSLVQRLLRVGGGASTSELLLLELAWAYDLDDAGRGASPYGDPLSPYYRTLRTQIDVAAGQSGAYAQASDLYGRLLLRPSNVVRLDGEVLFDVNEGNFTLGTVGAELRPGNRTRLLAEYRRTDILSEDVHGALDLRPLGFVQLLGDANYSIKLDKFTHGRAGLIFHPKSECWNIGVSVERKTDPDDTSYKFSFALRGIGDYGRWGEWSAW